MNNSFYTSKISVSCSYESDMNTPSPGLRETFNSYHRMRGGTRYTFKPRDER